MDRQCPPYITNGIGLIAWIVIGRVKAKQARGATVLKLSSVFAATDVFVATIAAREHPPRAGEIVRLLAPDRRGPRK